MILKEVTIHKYKSIEQDQKIPLEKDVTILVGMNEAGKTAVLESIAKTNYFTKDETFIFDKSHDYPRLEKKASDKKGDDPKAITCVYELAEDEIKKIESDVGKNVFKNKNISISTTYNNRFSYLDIDCNYQAFIDNLTVENELKIKFKEFSRESKSQFDNLVKEEKLDNDFKTKYSKYFENKYKWENPISCYIINNYIDEYQPKFLYYDEYYALPSRVNLEHLRDKKNGRLSDEEFKTANALIELADINLDELIKSNNFEDFKSELEATEANISGEMFKYWKSNQNIRIEFGIDKKESNPDGYGNRIVEHILDIRVKNNRTYTSLPLKNRSKGFNWFFSFLVWFKKIQEDKNSQYVILLDEPGLNLHASAQSDFLDFIEDLSKNYQIVYTTHSPFMIPNDKLHRVRTVYETNEKGTIVSESIQEKDPKTLFPLQAALGYDIAQNLYISKKNLLVEGVSDLIYLQAISSLLEQMGKVFLNSEITIVPVGGMEKVATFISLLRGNNLNIVCLLDSFQDQKSKSNLEKMIKEKIIHEKKIRFYHEFIEGMESADIEDMFEKEEYLELFNAALPEHGKLKLGDLSNDKQILNQIKNKIGDRFNHYRPANEFAKRGLQQNSLSEKALLTFEKMFVEINKLFK